MDEMGQGTEAKGSQVQGLPELYRKTISEISLQEN